MGPNKYRAIWSSRSINGQSWEHHSDWFTFRKDAYAEGISHEGFFAIEDTVGNSFPPNAY